jgi:tRNA (mo5U34)-methyltransferase
MNLKHSKAETLAIVGKHHRWFHQIDVGHGLSTPGTRNCQKKLEALDLPEDLTGWTVLDIGANDGFYSFECEERGADRVLATDYPHWTGGIEYSQQPGPARKGHFEAARELRGSSVEDLTISVYDLSSEELGTFNLVMMYGVLYHLVHFTVGLEKAVQMSDRLIIVETALHAENPSRDTPMSLFVSGPPSWWYPNPACIKAMMLFYGCEEVKIISSMEDWSRVVLHGYKNGYRPTGA